MATPDKQHEQFAFRTPDSIRLPSRWSEYLRPVVLVAVFGMLVAVVPVVTATGIFVFAPIASSVLGPVGSIVVWAAGIGLTAVTPVLVAECIGVS